MHTDDMDQAQAKLETGQGVGARVLRKEDDRYLRGQGVFVGDIKLPGMKELAFVRSPVAHAVILAVRKPAGYEECVFTAADLIGVKPIVANSGLPGFKPSAQPVLASDKVRHVGEAIAVCVAATRAEAEDIAALVEIDFDELPAVTDMAAAILPGSTLVHAHWGDNVFLETRVDYGFAAAAAGANP
jgi:carbon-monoxide dehydrogenase large subunit